MQSYNMTLRCARFVRQARSPFAQAAHNAKTLASVTSRELQFASRWELPVSQGPSGLPSKAVDPQGLEDTAPFDAFSVCGNHNEGMHFGYQGMAAYRCELTPGMAGKTLRSLTAQIYGDPYLTEGARVSVHTTDGPVLTGGTGVAAEGSGAYAKGQVKRTVSGGLAYGTDKNVTLASPGGGDTVFPPAGVTLKRYLWVLVSLENYLYVNGAYMEGAAAASSVATITVESPAAITDLPESMTLDDPLLDGSVMLPYGHLPKKTLFRNPAKQDEMTGHTNVYCTAENIADVVKPRGSENAPVADNPFHPHDPADFLRQWLAFNAHAYDGRPADNTGGFTGADNQHLFAKPLRGRTRAVKSFISLQDQPMPNGGAGFPPTMIIGYQTRTLTSETPMGLNAYILCGYADIMNQAMICPDRISIIQSFCSLPLAAASPSAGYSGIRVMNTFSSYGEIKPLRDTCARVDITPWLLPKETADEWGKAYYQMMKQNACLEPSFWRGDKDGAGPLVRLGPPTEIPLHMDEPQIANTGYKDAFAMRIPLPGLKPGAAGIIILAPRLKGAASFKLFKESQGGGTVRMNTYLAGLGNLPLNISVRTPGMDAATLLSDEMVVSDQHFFHYGWMPKFYLE